MTKTKLDNDGVGLDEGLDAEDVAGAMLQRASEKHLTSGKVREAYYNAYCYLRDLQDAAWDLKNERIERDSREALNHLQHIYDELEDKYQWD